MQTTGYAAQSAGSRLAPWTFERRALRDNDVAIEILYCGVCHSDLHQTRDDWGRSRFPNAGITVYSPLKQWKVGPGSRVGVIGIGGLGHLAVRLAAGLGAAVTVITRSTDKAGEAKALGAEQMLISTDDAAMAGAASSFDMIIDTIPVRHDIAPYLHLLDVEGVLVIVGLIGDLPAISTVPLILGRRRITGSPSGGIPETQALLDFCAGRGILPNTETIGIEDIHKAFARMERGDVRYRFVIDMASMPATCVQNEGASGAIG
ncbi:zinc-binding dehydrogenase [Novosphingobium rosa]|uniref:zinc-binding dehydrogenase n=1 Tax=Novosphingobium rosa TaxID=76978 RepID=UPI00082C4ADF|nr:zinc-binding dehydrogenase [Novosphingobium rosa]